MICAARCKTSTFLFLLLLRTSFLRMARRSPTMGALDRDKGPEMMVAAIRTFAKRALHFRVGHLVADLGWVDFVMGCSTVSQILSARAVENQSALA